MRIVSLRKRGEGEQAFILVLKRD